MYRSSLSVLKRGREKVPTSSSDSDGLTLSAGFSVVDEKLCISRLYVQESSSFKNVLMKYQDVIDSVDLSAARRTALTVTRSR